MHAVAISDNKASITAALSAEDERVELAAPVAINEKVESWLSRLSAAMQTSLQVDILMLCCDTCVPIIIAGRVFSSMRTSWS